MDLSEASAEFNNTTIDGWNTTELDWDVGVACGNVQVFDRFISDRSFGQRKRNFIVGGSEGIDSAYTVTRTPSGQVYMLEAKNVDQTDCGVYSNVYLFHEAPFVGELKEMQTTPRANGMPGTPVETVVDSSVFCDLDRYSFLDAEGSDHLRFGVYTVILPAYIAVNTEQWLTINGADYDIRELSTQLDLTYLRVVKRSAS